MTNLNLRNLIVPALLLIACVIIGSAWLNFRSVEHVRGVEIVRAERVVSGEHSHYRVYTDSEVFRNTDNLLFWKLNSSDIQAQFRPGRVCDLKVNWYRVRLPGTGMYRNILEADCE